MSKIKIAVVGTVGIPGCYGGFETLAENLARYSHKHLGSSHSLTIYCSASAYKEKHDRFLGARLRYSRLKANGPQSILYDVLTSINAAVRGNDVLLLLGVPGAIALPFLRLFSRMKIVTNIDGIEWRRDKWNRPARYFLRWSEAIAIRFSHCIIADNEGIADYVPEKYRTKVEIIAYGGDHAINRKCGSSNNGLNLDSGYILALCRIEPENNVKMILEACNRLNRTLVFIGNWNHSRYGRELRAKYSNAPNLYLLDPIFDVEMLHRIRSGAGIYIHGHSAGGTNPSLVEIMFFGIPVIAYDCIFNRYTTKNAAQYFSSSEDLCEILRKGPLRSMGGTMKRIADRCYRWESIGASYFSLLKPCKVNIR